MVQGFEVGEGGFLEDQPGIDHGKRVFGLFGGGPGLLLAVAEAHGLGDFGERAARRLIAGQQEGNGAGVAKIHDEIHINHPADGFQPVNLQLDAQRARQGR